MSSDPYSRPLACVDALGTNAADARRFPEKRVLLMGEARVLATNNGRLIALYCVRLLVRICRYVHVWIPEELRELRNEIEVLGAEIAFCHPLFVASTDPNAENFDAVLNIGTEATAGNMTVINSNGWLARVTYEGRLPAECDQPNPIGALAAASFGVSEIFKRLVGVLPRRGPYFGALMFSTYDWTTGGTATGPELPHALKLPRLLATGQGAIGNGITLLLAELPLDGEIFLLDRQAYGSENLGTCVLMRSDDTGKPKAVANTAWLRSQGKRNVEPLEGEIEKLLGTFGQKIPYPTVIVNGLDNVDARHAIQELWPDFLIDGAIGDFSCQVVTHTPEGNRACLKCMFEMPPAPDPDIAATADTGLSRDRVKDAEGRIDDTDIADAPAERKEFLQKNLGRKICSVISESAFSRIAKDTVRFSPSVPFVATMGAALAMSALVRHVMGHGVPAARFQFDMLVGPEAGEFLNERAKPVCYCQERKALIAEIRRSRDAGQS